MEAFKRSQVLASVLSGSELMVLRTGELRRGKKTNEGEEENEIVTRKRGNRDSKNENWVKTQNNIEMLIY